MTDFLPYGRQAIDEADIAAVSSALADPFITQGPRVESFERAICEYLGVRHAVAFANGTAALHAAAHAAGLGPGDELLTTPLSFVASANCALFVGARPRFYDIDPETANLDLQRALEAGLPQHVKACVAVSMAGLPIDLEPLRAARRDGLVVIEDASHALGARRAGLPLGGDAAADMTTFSFHPVKAITSGEGGMVSTNDDALAGALRSFRTHGIRRGEPERDVMGSEHQQDVMRGGWHYDIDSLGFNYRITDFQCALGEHQLARLDEFIAARNQIADRYRELLGGITELQLPAAADKPGDSHAYHLFVVRFREGASRRRAAYDHLRAGGIGVQLHYIPIPVHGLYRSLGYTMEGLQATQAYYEEALSLPIFPTMTDKDVERVAGEVRFALDAPSRQALACANTAENDSRPQSVESLRE
ncbi:MAG: aminotransferase class I/II-fold pyridoxal phosphate-dependent enzyme [Solirubrobacteraceae bacterium]